MPAEFRMLMVIHRSSLDHDVVALLGDLGVDAFTSVPDVLGVGARGRALHSLLSPGSNSLVVAVIEATRVADVVDGLRRFRERTDGAEREVPLPLHAFVLPCVQAL